MKKASLKQYLVVISILSLLFIALLVSDPFTVGYSMGRPTATATPEGDPLASYLESLQEELKDSQLDPDERKEIEERLQFFAQHEIIRQTATLQEEARFAELEMTSKSGSAPKSSRLTGITNDRFLLPGSDIVNENVWQDLVDGAYVTVYAGYQKNDPSLGEVCFVTDTTPLICIYSSDKTGSLRILELKEKEGKLILESKDGKPYFFDLRGRKFAKSLDEVVPTITPSEIDQKHDPKTPAPALPADYPAP